MIVWKNKLFIFGGFYDSASALLYYNDLHVFDTENMKWEEV